MTIEQLIDRVIEREGGFVDHLHDRGAATKYGITASTLGRWRGRHVTAREVRALDLSEARDIYSTQYIEQPGFLDLPGHGPCELREQVVDFGVIAGPAQ